MVKSGIVMSMVEEEERRAGRELKHILISMMRGLALDKVVNAGEFNGLDAWRLLTGRYDPKIKSRTAGQLVTLLGSLEDFEKGSHALHHSHRRNCVRQSADRVRVGSSG